MPNRKTIVALPLAVSRAVPITASPLQVVLMVASQKVTVPGVTAVPAEVTAAVSVTAVPEATDVTAAPALVTANVVVVAAAAKADPPSAAARRPTASATGDPAKLWLLESIIGQPPTEFGDLRRTCLNLA